MLAAFLGFAKGASERYSENIDLQAKREASLLKRMTEGKVEEQTILRNPETAFALSLAQQEQMGLIRNHESLYMNGKGLNMPNVAMRGKTPQETIANIFAIKGPSNFAEKSLLSLIDKNSQQYQKAIGIIEGQVREVMKDYRLKGEGGADLSPTPIANAIGYFDYENVEDRAILKRALQKAANLNVNAANVLQFTPDDPELEQYLENLDKPISLETLDFMERNGISSVQFQENPATRELKITTTDVIYKAPNGEITKPSSLDSGAKQVMFDFASKYSKEPPDQTARFSKIFKTGERLKSVSNIPTSIYVNTMQQIDRLSTNEQIKSSPRGIIYGDEQLKLAMAPVYYRAGFKEAVDVFNVAYMTQGNTYYSRSEVQTGPDALRETYSLSTPIFLENIGLDRGSLTRSRDSAKQLYRTAFDLYRLATNPKKEGDPGSGPVVLGPLGVLDQALLQFQTFGSNLNDIISRFSTDEGSIDDPNHFLHGVDREIAAISGTNRRGGNTLKAAQRQQLAGLLRKKLAYMFARSLESSTGNAPLSDTDVRLAGIAQGIEGLLANAKTAPIVLQYMMRGALKEIDYKDIMLYGEMEEMQSAYAMQQAFGTESMIRISDNILNDTDMTAEQANAEITRQILGGIEAAGQYDPDMKKPLAEPGSIPDAEDISEVL